jgi:anti-sigma factor RsiW
MHPEWTDKLSDYLDDELSSGERAAVDGHLAGCAACRQTLDELQRVVETARHLPPRPPALDLWTGVADRMAVPPGAAEARVTLFRPRQSRRISFTLPQLAAASLLLAAVSGALSWEFRGASPTTVPSATSRAASTVGPDAPAADFGARADATLPPLVTTVSMADAQYDAAVTDLEQALARGRGRLDTSTIAIVEQNLQIIDRAIAQARQALDADPANSYLSSHLVETRRKKLELLRRATALATELD